MEVEGHRFPGGTYRISREENAALCAAVGVDTARDGRAHPIFYYIATQVGMGMTVAELLAACDFDIADGPMMTGSEVIFTDELRTETDYRVDGLIQSLTPKPSRTFGTAEILRFRLTLASPDGTAVLECVNEWILPRGPKVTA
jgi:hypothetical protein